MPRNPEDERELAGEMDPRQALVEVEKKIEALKTSLELTRKRSDQGRADAAELTRMQNDLADLEAEKGALLRQVGNEFDPN